MDCVKCFIQEPLELQDITHRKYRQYVYPLIDDKTLNKFYEYQASKFNNFFNMTLAEFYKMDPVEVQASLMMKYEHYLKDEPKHNIFLLFPNIDHEKYSMQYTFIDLIFEYALEHFLELDEPYIKYIINRRNDCIKKNEVSCYEKYYIVKL